MNWSSLLKSGTKKPSKPQVTSIPLKWMFAGMAVVFFFCNMKWESEGFTWLASLSFIGFAIFYVLDKSG